MRKLLLIFVLSFPVCYLPAQEIRTVTVTDSVDFEETLQYAIDDKGLDLNVKISFDETANKLALSVASSRQMVVFRDETKYKDVFNSSRDFKPERLSYPVLIRPNTKYHLTYKAKKQFLKKRKHHIFNEWVYNMTPRQLTKTDPPLSGWSSGEAMVVSDSVIQYFDVNPGAVKAKVKLRNFVTADVAKVSKNGRKIKYNLVNDKNLNLTYDINIQRNPCFGKQPLIDEIAKRTADIEKAYDRLHKACPEGTVVSDEAEEVFRQHRQFLLSRFPEMKPECKCATVIAACAAYNRYVDSIKIHPCRIVEKEDIIQTTSGMRVTAKALLNAAHTLDLLVSKILLTEDMNERLDLIETGKEVINTIDENVSSAGLSGMDAEEAYDIYRQARYYFTYSL